MAIPSIGKSEPDNFIWQQDGVHHLTGIAGSNQWIGRKRPHDKACFAWHPRSPVLTPCDSYLSEFIKYYANADLPDLRHGIEAAVARITSDTLSKVCEELAYGIDVYRVTNETHIEHL
ncbi:uncharacterized protein TNCV_2943031 [Trichonephila clavipes]|nr:uncharacterized protein TNCV_2943031 [Trichonephila clavipes]